MGWVLCFGEGQRPHREEESAAGAGLPRPAWTLAPTPLGQPGVKKPGAGPPPAPPSSKAKGIAPEHKYHQKPTGISEPEQLRPLAPFRRMPPQPYSEAAAVCPPPTSPVLFYRSC